MTIKKSMGPGLDLKNTTIFLGGLALVFLNVRAKQGSAYIFKLSTEILKVG